jgi:hypothetical protein
VIAQVCIAALLTACTPAVWKAVTVLADMPKAKRRRSEAAYAVARAIAAGEAVALAAPDRLAVMNGCAERLRNLIQTTPRCEQALQVWEDGLRRTTGAAAYPDMSDPLALIACLIYSSDLAFEERMAAGLSLQAVHDVDVPTGYFLLSGFLEEISGYYQLQAHRKAGIADRLGDGERMCCPFCGLGDYDQTIIGCDRCTTDGGYVRTFPAWWTGGGRLPARVAPDPTAARARSRQRHERLVADLQQTM